jgi:phosphoribosylformylglycinamidine synthase
VRWRSDNPIRFMHDVGAGGLSNAIPELLHDSGVGGVIDWTRSRASTLVSPMQLWCNESQERYVLGVAPTAGRVRGDLRARALPYAVVGRPRRATAGGRLDGVEPLADRVDAAPLPIDMPMDCCSASRRRCIATAHAAAPRWPRLEPHARPAASRPARARASHASRARISWSRSATAPSAA